MTVADGSLTSETCRLCNVGGGDDNEGRVVRRRVGRTTGAEDDASTLLVRLGRDEVSLMRRLLQTSAAGACNTAVVGVAAGLEGAVLLLPPNGGLAAVAAWLEGEGVLRG